MPFLLAGLGTALPEHSIDQADAATIAATTSCDAPEHHRLMPVLYRRSGVGRRHSVLLDASDGDLSQRQSFFPPRGSETDFGPTTAERMRRYATDALPLATRAAAAAFDDAELTADRVTHLVTVSCSGFAAPGWDIGLIDALGLPRSVSRTHVGFMGCHGALNGLRVAKAFTDADPKAVVLVTAVELCSLHHRYGWEPERIVSNALFADGAAAVVGISGRAAGVSLPVLSRSERVQRAEERPVFPLTPDPSPQGEGDRNRRGREHSEEPAGLRRPLALVASGSFVVPETADAMSWGIGDHGFEMTLSPRVPDLIRQTLRLWLEDWLTSQGVPLDRVGSWAVHPGGPRILGATGEAIGLPGEALSVSRDVLRECGNMSSPTVLFLLDRLRRQDAPRPCVALGFGPGLTIEAALFE